MNEKKLKKLKEIAPSLWSSYQHMYDMRRTGIQNRANFLLVIISFLSAISISLFIEFDDRLFLISFFLQLISFVVLLKIFFIKDLKVHWFESKSFLNNLDKDQVYQDLFADLKALESETYGPMLTIGRITKVSLGFLLLSLYTLALTFIIKYIKGTTLYFALLLLMISIVIICFYYKKQPHFSYDEDYKKYRKEIDNWIAL